MMNLMAKDPQGAQELITGMLEGSTVVADATQAHTDRMQAFQDEFNGLKEDYATKAQAIDKLFDTVPRYDPGGPSVTKAETEAALAKANGAYMASCKTDLFEGPMIPLVLRCLAENASQYTPPNGRAEVRIAAEPGRVRVEFSSGSGSLSAADLPHLFERFYRGDKSRSRQHGGAGIGLAFGKELVEAHGGRVGAELAGDTVRIWFELPTGQASAG